MTVKISDERKAYVLTYDTSKVEGPTADVRYTNPADASDVSTVDAIDNDGNAVVTFPVDFSGETDVLIMGLEGGEDTGTIEV